ncbi:hypothetical protein [Streptomyces odontomachi]|uniref:hypothetical protein n=1 Tax=Streptomyces odontomachi TaxID=2944940 RepID=UPI00210CA1E4|nr:hypothetical protein [Streptomyces sp. ODS25]
MASRKTVMAWLTLNVVMIVLYTCVPPVFFNDGAGRVAGMPEMLFWFTLMPLVIPALMALLYLYDRRLIHDGRPPAGKATERGETS